MLKQLDDIVKTYLISYCIEILDNMNIAKAELYGGIAHGVYTITKTDRLIYRCVFKNGRMNGVVEKWYDNGKLEFKCTYKNGKPNGLYQKWHKTGALYVQCEYIDGEKHGKYQQWFPFINTDLLHHECFEFDHGVIIDKKKSNDIFRFNGTELVRYKFKNDI